MAYFELGRHDEPSMVYWSRWRDTSNGVGVCPRRKLTYPYLHVRVFMPYKRTKKDPPDSILLGDGGGWTMVRSKAPNAYVKSLRQQNYRVYTIDLTIMRDYTKFYRDTHYVPHQPFDYRVSVMLEVYSYWTVAGGKATGLNTAPPRFEIIFDWIAKHVESKWSFGVNVAQNWKNFAFEFAFENRADAAKFMAAWR